MAMATNSNRESLSDCLSDLTAFDHPGKQLAAAQRIHSRLSEIAGLNNDQDSPDNHETILSCGKAISPSDAARCVLDFFRTSKFVEGTLLAMSELKNRVRSRPIEILYAGTGPFAPYALAIANRFTADEVQITLLDIHQWSLDAAKRILESYGLSDRIRDAVCCDATTYRHNDAPPDLLIAETMQRALTKEPEVEVLLNLVPQLSPEGILVPESIRVEVQLANMANEFGEMGQARERIAVGTLIELTADSIRSTASARNWITKPVVLQIADDAKPHHRVLLCTNVKVFGAAELSDYDSGISYPVVLSELKDVRPGDRVEFRYELGSNPGFSYRVL